MPVSDQVAPAVAEAGREHPLTGVVHLAAVIDDGVVRNQTAERFERVLAPKLTGAWHLHELTRDLDLDLAAFVLFSSVARTLGSPGQGSYGAANAFLDALAPTPWAIADFLRGRLPFDEPASGEAPPQDPVRAAQWALDRVSPDLLRPSGLLDRLLELARPEGSRPPPTPARRSRPPGN